MRYRYRMYMQRATITELVNQGSVLGRKTLSDVVWLYGFLFYIIFFGPQKLTLSLSDHINLCKRGETH